MQITCHIFHPIKFCHPWSTGIATGLAWSPNFLAPYRTKSIFSTISGESWSLSFVWIDLCREKTRSTSASLSIISFNIFSTNFLSCPLTFLFFKIKMRTGFLRNADCGLRTEHADHGPSWSALDPRLSGNLSTRHLNKRKRICYFLFYLLEGRSHPCLEYQVLILWVHKYFIFTYNSILIPVWFWIFILRVFCN